MKKSNPFVLRLSEEDRRAIDEIAQDAGLNRSAAIRLVIRAGLGDRALEKQLAEANAAAMREQEISKKTLLAQLSCLAILKELGKAAGVDYEKTKAAAQANVDKIFAEGSA